MPPSAFATRVAFPVSSPSPLIHVDSIPSTNDLASELLVDPHVATPHLTTVIAREQTNGHGRLGRTWTSFPGRSLTASTIVSLPTSLKENPTTWIPLLGALAVRDTIATRLTPLGHSVSLKWPNDVLIDDSRKICGILATLAPASSAFVTSSILGYGVNISMEPHERPTPTATSLSLEGDVEAALDPLETASSLLNDILTGIDLRIRALAAADGDAGSSGLADEASAHCSTLGRNIRIAAATDASLDMNSDSLTDATAQALASNGSLIVRLTDGTTQTISAGDIHVINHTTTDR